MNGGWGGIKCKQSMAVKSYQVENVRSTGFISSLKISDIQSTNLYPQVLPNYIPQFLKPLSKLLARVHFSQFDTAKYLFFLFSIESHRISYQMICFN